MMKPGWKRRDIVKLAAAAGLVPAWPGSSLAAGAPDEIAPGIYVDPGEHDHVGPDNQGHIANVGFVVGKEAVAVIDSGGSAAHGQRFRKAIQSVTDLPIRYVIATHVHPDHLFGHAAFLGDRPSFVGHRKLPASLAQRGTFYLDNLMATLGPAAEGTEIVMPDLLVDDETDLDLGGRRLTLRAHETAHTDNDLTILDQESGLLFAGDLLFMERCPVLDGSLLGWLGVMEQLAVLGATGIVPGHGPAVAPLPAALEPQARYLTALRDAVRGFLAEGGLLEDAVHSTPLDDERSRWALFDETHGRNVSAAYAELEWE